MDKLVLDSFTVAKIAALNKKAEHRRLAALDYSTAQKRALGVGLLLVQHSFEHYSLRDKATGSILHIYPGNRRLFWDQGRRLGPYLRLASNWTLDDIVLTYILTMEGKGSKWN